MAAPSYRPSGGKDAKESMMPNAEYTDFKALDPFFEVVQEGLSGFVDGEHYFDTIADDALFGREGHALQRRPFPNQRFGSRALTYYCKTSWITAWRAALPVLSSLSGQ
jgi:hypothetical protein